MMAQSLFDGGYHVILSGIIYCVAVATRACTEELHLAVCVSAPLQHQAASL